MILDVEMRKADVEECKAGGFTPDVALDLSIQLSDHWVLHENEGDLCAAYGWKMESFITGSARVWCLTFAGADRHKMFFARESQRQMRYLLARFRTLRCDVHVEHKAAVRWLLWLGFAVEYTRHHGPNNEPFYVMKKERG